MGRKKEIAIISHLNLNDLIITVARLQMKIFCIKLILIK